MYLFTLMSHSRIGEQARTIISEYVDELTGTIWRGAYMEGIVEVPGQGVYTAPEPVASAEDFTFKFKPMKNHTLKVVRKAVLNSGHANEQANKQKYLAAVSVNGDIAMVGRKGSDRWDGDIDLATGTISFLRIDQDLDADVFTGHKSSVYSMVLAPNKAFNV